VTSPQWIRPSVDEYERLQERLSLALKSLAAAEAKLADERKHADMLHRALHAYALNDAATGTQPPASALAAMDAHASRRNAEKEAAND